MALFRRVSYTVKPSAANYQTQEQQSGADKSRNTICTNFKMLAQNSFWQNVEKKKPLKQEAMKDQIYDFLDFLKQCGQ